MQPCKFNSPINEPISHCLPTLIIKICVFAKKITHLKYFELLYITLKELFEPELIQKYPRLKISNEAKRSMEIDVDRS